MTYLRYLRKISISNWGKSQILLYTRQNWGNLKIEDEVEENLKCWIEETSIQENWGNHKYFEEILKFEEISNLSSFIQSRPGHWPVRVWYFGFPSHKRVTWTPKYHFNVTGCSDWLKESGRNDWTNSVYHRYNSVKQHTVKVLLLRACI